MDELLRNRQILLLLATYGALLAVAVAELAAERRPPDHSALRRWISNLALSFAGRGFVRWLFPIGALALTVQAERAGFGILNWIELPEALSILLTLIALDGIGYALHRLNHAVPLLWRFHRVHHADLDLDFSTSERHHPLESLVNTLLRLACVGVLGASPAGLILYALLMGPVDALAHGNLRLPGWLDRGLRLAIVTPDMHAVHHSARRLETDSNFGSLLSVWDRLFGSYRFAPRDGYQGVRYGLEDFRSERDLDLDHLLLQPFRRAEASGRETA